MKIKTVSNLNIFSAIAVWICIAVATPAFATDPATATSERIKGVSQFLLNRAEDNFLYVFERKIENNKLFECYFPNTHYYVSSSDLKTLLTGGKEVWKDNVELDLQALLQFYIIAQLNMNNITNRDIFTLVEKNLKKALTEGLAVKLDDVIVKVDSDMLDLDKKIELKNLLMEYKQMLENLLVKIDELSITISSINSINGDEAVDASEDAKRCYNTPKWRTAKENPWRPAYIQLKEIAKEGKILFSRIYGDNKDKLLKFADPEKRLNLIQAIKDKLSASWWLVMIENQLKQKLATNTQVFNQHIKTILDVANSRSSAVVKFIELEKVFKQVEDSYISASPINPVDKYFLDYFGRDRTQIIIQAEIENQSIAKDKTSAPYLFDTESAEYQKMRKYVIFFAQLSDAEDADEVQAILKSVTLPSVSFGLKRQPDEYHVLLSSYLGVTISESESQQNNFFGTLMAPIGLEWSRGCESGSSFICPSKGSFSLMIAPIDLSYPINLELKEVEESVELDDIYVLGIYAAWGLKDLPITVGAGWQRGRSLVTDSDEDEDRVLMFIAFDMPLFLFH